MNLYGRSCGDVYGRERGSGLFERIRTWRVYTWMRSRFKFAAASIVWQPHYPPVNCMAATPPPVNDTAKAPPPSQPQHRQQPSRSKSP